ncbi:M91 family zinc metallopeptidase [Pseudomonas sp. MWU16-30323]|uniref:M91 family zinc metallopeptidase n=1 Tax=Pseudomonas sp. MWU16-30323 TaxID=2878094 RepID=UPI001CFAD043|nr:M91 family zinc metallopeptidase [Pseudomonas sp. MWU16-30323]
MQTNAIQPPLIPSPPASAGPKTLQVAPAKEPESPEKKEVIASDKNLEISLITKTFTLDTPKGSVEKNAVMVEIQTQDDADNIHISKGPDGQLSAFINGKSYLLPTLLSGNSTAILRINSNGGDDKIHINPDVMATVYVNAGDGDDHIQGGGGTSHLYGGAGNDYIQAGGGKTYISGDAGNDTIKLGPNIGYAQGGDGDDTMMGGTGDFAMYGGNGNDSMYAGYGPPTKSSYMDGGAGNDRMYGGSGHNILIGNKGDDEIHGFDKSTIYTGKGQDRVQSTSAGDTVYGKRGDSLSLPPGVKFVEVTPTNAGQQAIFVAGSPEFKQRVEDELEFLRSSPSGQKMLEKLEEIVQHTGTTIQVRDAAVTRHQTFHNPGESVHIQDGKRGHRASASFIGYNPQEIIESEGQPGLKLLPLVTLYHEMGHAYNAGTGSMLPGTSEVHAPNGQTYIQENAELQVIGVENEGPAFDFDDDPTTAPTTTNPAPFTENSLRKEMGLPLRKTHS